MSYWKSGELKLQVTAPAGEISEIILNPALIPESDYGNNKWRK